MSNKQRSITAILVSIILKIRSNGAYDTVAGAKKHLKKQAMSEDEPLKFSAKKYDNFSSTIDFQGMQVLSFGDEKKSDYTILYIHGGGYVNQIISQHFQFCNTLSKRLNAHIIIPIYPLAPNHTYQTCYQLITNLYKDILTNKTNKLILMGDSAGGGFSLSFCQYITTCGLQQPDQLIVFSPWVDVSMSGKRYDAYNKKDPMLGVDGARELGKSWAGELDAKDPKISPLFGDNSALPDTLIFTGTYEVFYPDIIDYYEKIKKQGVSAQLIVGEKMNHVYPLYPIPEAKTAMEQVINNIKS